LSGNFYTLTKAAVLIGVAPITLKRWLLAAKVTEVSRDRNNWRKFSAADIRRIRKYAKSIVPPKKRRHAR